MLAHVAEYIEIVIFYNTYSWNCTVFKKTPGHSVLCGKELEKMNLVITQKL